jgi:hypothetical protein
MSVWDVGGVGVDNVVISFQVVPLAPTPRVLEDSSAPACGLAGAV